jgi:arylsulfatase A-like enzyme
MAFRRISFVLARAYFCLFVLLTSFYCLLSYIPFSYHWFIKFSPVAWLPQFARFHPYLWIIAIAAIIPTISGAFREPRTRRVTMLFVAACIASAIFLIFKPFLLDVPNDYRAFIWALLTLFPVAWLAAIDLMVRGAPAVSRDEINSVSPMPALIAAAFIAVSYSMTSFIRFDLVEHYHFGRPEALAMLFSLGMHLVVIAAVFVCFEIFRTLAVQIPALRGRSTQIALAIVAFAASGILLRKLVLATLGFNHWWADVYAAAVSFVAVLAVIAVCHRLSADQLNEVTDRKEVRTLFGWLALATIVIVIAFAPVIIGRNDWNFLLKKIVAVIVWGAVLLTFYFLFPRHPGFVGRKHIVVIVCLAAACFTGYKLFALPLPSSINDSLDAYAGYDTSFRLVREILAPTLDDESYIKFYDFLLKNTSLTESVQIQPVPIRIVDDLKPTTTERPHIFYFIVDSLRQDYLASYNDKVNFTPNFDAFGRESVVFKNAFTRYGGTVLSIPALWTGSMQLHKQYIQPFYPMAEMQQLVDADHYQKWITMDPVIKLLMRPDPQIDELDRNATYWTEYDLNGTLKEVETRIESRGIKDTSNEPLFVYSQAHNTHTATLSLLRKKRPPRKAYPGFNDQYASEVERMDGGFGEFIAFLKSHGLYDNSIVILTSDHGDSLGEFGRWGHGSTLFPEVVRVPLLVHLPVSMQKLYSDPQAVAFSMDVTESLFYLLGHRPIRDDEILGRPLFTETKAEHDAYVRDAYLLVSSYGPVYARLSDRGRSLFIVDAAAHQNYLYDLAADPAGIHNRLTARDFPENERFIRQHVEGIARFFHYSGGLETQAPAK